MDIVLHPRFPENRWVYFVYHKPVPGGEGATTPARGTWDGQGLVDVHDIFASGARGTEASRIVFGNDGLIYMSISGPGSGPEVGRAQDPAITRASSCGSACSPASPTRSTRCDTNIASPRRGSTCTP